MNLLPIVETVAPHPKTERPLSGKGRADLQQAYLSSLLSQVTQCVQHFRRCILELFPGHRRVRLVISGQFLKELLSNTQQAFTNIAPIPNNCQPTVNRYFSKAFSAEARASIEVMPTRKKGSYRKSIFIFKPFKTVNKTLNKMKTDQRLIGNKHRDEVAVKLVVVSGTEVRERQLERAYSVTKLSGESMGQANCTTCFRLSEVIPFALLDLQGACSLSSGCGLSGSKLPARRPESHHNGACGKDCCRPPPKRCDSGPVQVADRCPFQARDHYFVRHHGSSLQIGRRHSAMETLAQETCAPSSCNADSDLDFSHVQLKLRGRAPPAHSAVACRLCNYRSLDGMEVLPNVCHWGELPACC